jgi:methionine-rich copper-binding protein CopC
VRITIVAVAGWFVFALAPSPALGHAELNESSPPKGSRVKGVPEALVLSMSETPVEPATDMFVLDGCGNPVVVGVSTHEREIHVEIEDSAQPGRWRIEWETLSADDGHGSSGSFGFRVRGDQDCPDEDDGAGADERGEGDDSQAVGDPSADDERSGLPVVPIVIGAGALIGIAALARGTSGKA